MSRTDDQRVLDILDAADQVAGVVKDGRKAWDQVGDFNLTAINPNATPTMRVLQPGQSIVVPVTITPSGTVGSVVSGTLYVDALVGGLLPVGGASGVLPAGQISGVEMAALPYEYTIG